MFRPSMLCLVFMCVVLSAVSPEAASTVTVVSLADDGSPGTLRSALAGADPGDTIQVNVSGTIALASTLVVDRNVTITGPGASTLTLSGNNATVVVQVNNGVTATMSGLGIKNGAGTWSGGGINNAGTLTLINTIVSNNHAFQGAAIWNTGTLAATDAVMSGNATGSCCGGAIANLGTVTLTRTVLSQNSVSFFGGGLYNDGTATVIDSTISGNAAYLGGGIQNNATLRISGSTINGNTASYGGAGISTHGPAVITNTTIAANQASSAGGGIYNYGGLDLSHSTVSGNSASGSGSNVWNSATLRVRATIVANSLQAPNCNGAAESSGYNLSDDASCLSAFTDATDVNNVPAGLDPAGLQDNGGSTLTISPLATSAVVDALGSASCTDVAGNDVTVDQRGVPRPQGGACDIGSVEYKSPDSTPPVITAHVDGTVGGNGWYVGPVNVTWSISEEESPSTLVATGCEPVTVAAETAGTTLTCQAASAGGESHQSVTIKVDLAPPIISVAADTTVMWPANGKLTAVAFSGMVSDLGSGVDPASVAFVVHDEYGRVQPSGSVAIGADGHYAVSVNLEASRLGSDADGRQYVVLVTGRDRAGHAASATTTVTVAHDQRK